MTDRVKRPRGLAALKLSDPERFKEIVNKGANIPKSSQFTKENAREMALKSWEKRRAKNAN